MILLLSGFLCFFIKCFVRILFFRNLLIGFLFARRFYLCVNRSEDLLSFRDDDTHGDEDQNGKDRADHADDKAFGHVTQFDMVLALVDLERYQRVADGGDFSLFAVYVGFPTLCIGDGGGDRCH